MKTNRFVFRPPRLAAKLLLGALGASAWAVIQAATIPDTPLHTTTSVEPNVMMILDDSGSMHFEIMPDDYTFWGNDHGSVPYVFPRASDVYSSSDYDNRVATVDSDRAYTALTRSPQINSIYYNPSVTYTPWVKYDGALYPNASITCALHNPERAGTTAAYCRNLTANMGNYNDNSWHTCYSGGTCGSTSTAKTFWPATYFWYNGGGIWTWDNYTRVEIKSGNTYSGHGREKRTDCSSGVCTYEQEIQNFANWYTYYRSRILTARAGIGRAFAAQGTRLRVGFAAINKGSTTVDGASRRTIIRGVRSFSGTNRSNFFSDLYTHLIPVSGTPLRRALDDVGQYFSWTDERGPWSTTPGTTGGTAPVCRQSYAILMTDGYWSEGTDYQASTEAARSDNDSTSGPTVTGPDNQTFTFSATSPFTDGRANTLADVAMHYWKNDLHTGIANKVPKSTRDPAFWQHMVTFGVGLGVTGSVNPDTAFAAISSGASVTWPTPVDSDPGKLDDLLHAAVNSRGAFFSAQNPEQFSSSLTKLLTEIVNRTSSAASVTANSTKLTTSSLIFNAFFNTNNWSGELEAYGVSESGLSSSPKWQASSMIPAADSRKIFTISGNTRVEFKWANLSTTDQTALVSTDVVEYIRGDRSKEIKNGGSLRSRSSLLGDIVHSSPFYSRETNTVFVGANDGMLHAFDAGTGVERFAYIPSPAIAKLNQLSQPAYEHKFFVDGDIYVASKTQTFLDKTYLVATLGRGGKGLFALDVSSPSTFGAANVAWEYVGTADADLGMMLGKPIIARLNNDKTAVIVGNGYNSTSGKAVLYIFDVETGSLIKKFDTGVASDNGMASPAVFDADADGYIDQIYAGDLKGNVWKFDVSDANPSRWDVAFKQGSTPKPLFVAKDASGNLQPITAPVAVARNFAVGDPNLGKIFVFVGTGAYFRSDDPTDKSVQSWYGLIDNGAVISARTALTQRTIAAEWTQDGKPVRSFSLAVTDDMKNKSGWYLDWIKADGSKVGERIITGSEVYRFNEPTLVASTIIPVADDPCLPGGTGYLNAVNAFTGASLTKNFFVFEGYTGTATIGSLDMGLGMLSQAAVLAGRTGKGRIVVSGSGDEGGGNGNTGLGQGLVGSNPVDTGKLPRGRLSWREIMRN